jgi:hypothetical protein
MALKPEGSITINFTMMVSFLGYVPETTGSSIDSNGILVPASIFISSKVVLYRISAELHVSIRIRRILWLAISKVNTKALVCGIDTPA